MNYKKTLSYNILTLNIEGIKRSLYYTARGISIMLTLGRFPLNRYSKDE